MMIRGWTIGGAIAIVSIGFLTGCNGKLTQCKNLVRVVNNTVSQTDSLTNKGTKGDASTLKQSADIFEKAAQEMGGINVEDAKLKTYRDQFMTMYKSSSELTKQIVVSLEQKKSTQVFDGLRKLRSIGSPEQDLVQGLNQYCTKEGEGK
jgi:hypothetical protein